MEGLEKLGRKMYRLEKKSLFAPGSRLGRIGRASLVSRRKTVEEREPQKKTRKEPRKVVTSGSVITFWIFLP